MLVIRTFEARPDSKFAEVDRVEIEIGRVEVVHRATEDGGSSTLIVDEQPRTIELVNEDSLSERGQDTFVGQFQVPVGFVSQIRIRATRVTLHLKDGTEVELPVDNPYLPSWRQTGWKIASESGDLFPIVENELTGVRGLMDFGNRLVRPQSKKKLGWKIKPTLDAELFEVNPEDDQPGIHLDKLTVVFKNGTTRETVDSLNAKFGATVVKAPVIGEAYWIKLPASATLGDAFDFYTKQPEVQGVLPAANHAEYATPDLTQDDQEDANLPAAWDFVEQQLGSVGSYRVRVAVVDTGINLVHPELLTNIAINQGELPREIFDLDGDGEVSADERAASDTDGDGIITFADLNSDDFDQDALPDDSNDVDGIDAEDLLADPRWANHRDEDKNGLKDDLVGYDFVDQDNDPTYDPGKMNDDHGTKVAEILGGIGDNDLGIAGSTWRVSIVPLRVRSNRDEIEAFRYAERQGIPIVNLSRGITYATRDADLRGAIMTSAACSGNPTNLPPKRFKQKLKAGINAFRKPPWFDPKTNQPLSHALYVVAAGNCKIDIGQDQVLQSPAELLKAVIPDHTLIVGWSLTEVLSDPRANFGSPIEIWVPGSLDVVFADIRDPAVAAMEPLDNLTGSSTSAPLASGVAALALSLFPSLDPAAVHAQIVDTAPRDLDVVINNVPRQSDQPRLDALEALTGP